MIGSTPNANLLPVLMILPTKGNKFSPEVDGYPSISKSDRGTIEFQLETRRFFISSRSVHHSTTLYSILLAPAWMLRRSFFARNPQAKVMFNRGKMAPASTNELRAPG